MASNQYPDITNDERDSAFKKLKSDQENNRCIDCEKKNTKWASIHLGLFLCIDCAGKHRAWGPSFSLVRSMTLDSWNLRYLTFLEKGGNQNFLSFIRNLGLAINSREIDYKNSAIQQYKAHLNKIVEEELKKYEPKVEAPQQPQVTKQPIQQSFQEQPQQVQQMLKQEPPKEEAEFQNNFLNNQTTKVKSQQVVFKTNNNNQKTNQKKIKAEKLDELDFDSLNFDDGIDKSVQENKSATKQANTGNDFQLFEEEFPEYQTKKMEPVNNYVPSEQQMQQLEKMKKENVKSISSDTIFNQPTQNQQEIKQNYGKFQGAQAISSKAFFGQEGDDNEEEDQSGEKLETLKNLFWNIKDTATEYFDKLKNRK